MVELPRAVRIYVLLIASTAALLWAAVMGAGDHSLVEIRSRSALLALLYIGTTILAGRFPLHLTYKTKVFVDTAILTAAALVFDVPTAMAVAAVGIGVNQAIIHDSWEQGVFNTAQTALYVGMGGLVYHTLAGRAIPPALPGLGNLAAVLGGALTMHLLNTLTVATVGALQVGFDPYRAWIDSFALDLPEHVALVVFGVLIALVTRDEPWALPIFALPIVVVYASLRRNVQVRRSLQDAIESLATMVELRDPHRTDHSRRVAERTRQLAERLGISPGEAEHIIAAARVHDVGELGLNPTLLTKPGPLNGADWDEVHRHPTVGEQLAGQFSIYALGARCIRHHHERWDGRGYPDGLAGNAIPLGARLIAVADAFDAMISPRSYRPAMTIERALSELARGAGQQWDPAVAAAMMAIVGEELARADRRPAAPQWSTAAEPAATV